MTLEKPQIYAALTFETSADAIDKADEGEQKLESSVTLIENQDDLKRVTPIEDLHILPIGDERSIIYSLRSTSCLLVNSSSVELLNRVKHKSNIRLDKETLALLNYFILYRVLVFPEDVTAVESECVNDQNTSEFCYEPVDLSLCPTADCNLRCIYCYASGGKKPRYMDFSLAKHAIDFVIANALRQEKEGVEIAFHGGGEPMMAFDIIKESVDYTRMRCGESGLICAFGAGTNLYYGEEKLHYLVDNFCSATVSLDGMKEIHDLQRPTPDGSGSFDVVAKNLKYLDEKNFTYVLRTTVTQYNLHRLSEITEFFISNFGALEYNFEPLVLVSRALDGGLEGVGYEEFFEEFLKAREIAKNHGKDIKTTCVDLFKFSQCFCGALTGGFWVTPDGNVTTCGEVLEPGDPLAKYFMIGKFDSDRGEFVFDFEKIKRLRKRVVDNMNPCRECFAKYHCSGQCPARVMRGGAGLMDVGSTSDIFCRYTREIVKKKLLEMLDRKECRVSEEDYIQLGEPEKLSGLDFSADEFRLVPSR